MNRQTLELQAPQTLRSEPQDEGKFNGPPRLVVVFQHVEQEAMLASRILDLAHARGLRILLLGIAPDSSTAAEVRRRLVTVAAFIREEQARIGPALARGGSAHAPEIVIEAGRRWIGGVESVLREDDLLACYSQPSPGFLERPLDGILGSALNRAVYIFTGPPVPRSGLRHTLGQAAAWLGSLASIAGFLLLEMRIVPMAAGWVQTALLLILLGVEVGWIWLWNSWFGSF
jgi:hypothetical protein